MTTPSIFRDSAVERLSDPDQLDRLLVVTSRPAWASLAAIWLVIACTAVWAVAGRLPTTVEGNGLLLSAAGLRDVAALGAGVVDALPVRVGDQVEPGTIVARIRQPLIEQQVAQAEQRVRTLRTERDTRGTFVQRGAAVETSRLDAARDDILRRQQMLTERIRYLEGRVAAEREARAAGLVTEQSVQASVVAVEAARSELASLDLDLRNNALRRIQSADENTERVTEVAQRLQDAERELAALRLSLDQASRVTSTQRGTVREIRSSVGQLVAAGQPILSIEPVGAPLQGVVFVARDAKKIAPGMRVRVSPATVAREEFGDLVGTVRAVSTQPATLAGMTRTLGNDLLVQQLAAAGASFLVEITLERDSSTTSGFRWSSKQGPPTGIGSGTTIRVDVEVQRRRPIELLLPFLRRAAGLSA
jgi:HlyD family secretion protein